MVEIRSVLDSIDDTPDQYHDICAEFAQHS